MFIKIYPYLFYPLLYISFNYSKKYIVYRIFYCMLSIIGIPPYLHFPSII